MGHGFIHSLQDKNVFSVTWELIPGRGSRETVQKRAILSAEEAAKGDKVHALTITDNAGGNPALLADYLGEEISKLGIDPLVHFTCKDKNRNQIESQLHALDRAGVYNLLVMTGDYPRAGYKGRSKPVFDLDPTHILELISQMNSGLIVKGVQGPHTNKPSQFYAGAVVSPFKATEAEQMVQYFKLKKKVAAGAQFIITQLGYDARKFHEVLEFKRLHRLNVPVIGAIYVLNYPAAKIMNRNKLPGCVVTDKLLSEVGQEGDTLDSGLSAGLIRAAKLYALLKGMGYDGVHIGGNNLQYQHVEYIIEKGNELSGDWLQLIPEFDYPIPGGFYYFEKDVYNGLNSQTPVDCKKLPRNAPVNWFYYLMRMMHDLAFTPDKGLFPLMQKIYKGKDPRPHAFEHVMKVLIADCKDCGDCALLDLAYLCPMSQCPKGQRNGACGGSFNGWCEVYPDRKQCIYVRAYARLKACSQESQLESYRVDPVDWELYQTSSWSNFFLGKDHSARILGIKPPL